MADDHETNPEHSFPRTYRTGQGWIIALIVTTGLGEGVFLVFFIFAALDASELVDLLLILVPLVMIGALGMLGIVSVMKRQVILNRDRITVIAFGQKPRSLSRHDIEGRLEPPSRGVRTRTLVPRDRNMKRISLGAELKTDEVFEQWVTSIPEIR